MDREKTIDDYESIDDIISVQTNRRNNLSLTISLMEDRKYLEEDFTTAVNLMKKIRSDMQSARQELTKSRQILAKSEDLDLLAIKLQSGMDYMMSNLPEKFNKVRILEETKENIPFDENVPPTPQLPTRRYLDFAENECPSARKPVEVHPKLQYLTQTEFLAIPGYLRGRMNYTIINEFIDTVNKCLQDKYALLKTPKATLKKRSDIDKFTTYKRQECQKTKGKRFVTQDDLKCTMGGKLDRNTLKLLLPMLRHTGRLQEVHEAGLIRYLATTDILKIN